MTIRGAYVVKLDLDQPHLAGVADKIRAQRAALECLPAEVDLYHLSGPAIVRNGEAVRCAGKGALAKRFAHYALFNLTLGSIPGPLDFVYMRYQGSSPLLGLALRRLRRRNPGMVVIVEFPSWPYHTEAVSIRDRILGWIDRWSRRGLHRVVDRVVTFSRESRILGIPTIATDNGVDVARMPELPPPPEDGVVRLLGLANLSFWHGYDRVVEGMARYFASGGAVDVHFDIIGTGTARAQLEQLVARHGLGGRVHFHGPRRGAELDALLSQADIGVSSIGMHRLEVDTSNLKSREFCARGLPFVIAYPDRDFPPGLPFAYHAPADETALDIHDVIAFHRRLLAECPDYRPRMRAYAEGRLDWSAKMQPVLDALSALLPAGDDHA
jgi:glycosyltransferase involved in cell wall biosynthesis